MDDRIKIQDLQKEYLEFWFKHNPDSINDLYKLKVLRRKIKFLKFKQRS